MADALIVLILVVVLIFALKGTIKHFRGEGACCGGGSGKVRRPKDKILDGPVTVQKTVRISGMHCENCVNSVARAINKVEGASAKVNLREGTAVVSCDREVDDEKLRRAVEKAGFEVVSIS